MLKRCEKIRLQKSKSESSDSTNSPINKDYFLKYDYNSAYVIGDNELKQNIEILIGTNGLYCAYHNNHNQKKIVEY